MMGRRPRALVLAAADRALVEEALARLRERLPEVHLTVVARAGWMPDADRVVTAAAEGPCGFRLRPRLLREVSQRFDLAWAVVGDLEAPAYRRVAVLLALARAAEKSVAGPGGELIGLETWRARAGMSLGPSALLAAGMRRLLQPHRRARALRLLRRDRPPWGFRRVNIGISDRCNQRCVMCSEHSPYCADGGRRMAAAEVLEERDFGLMEPGVYHSLIDDLHELGCREIEICGLGEPLLHPRAIGFLRQAKGAGLWVRLVTNASLIDDDRARELVALGLDEIHISLNAATPETYAAVHGVAPSVFERVLAAIRGIAAARRAVDAPGPTIETSFVVQAANWPEAVQWVETVASAGVDRVTFSALGAAPAGAPVRLADEQMERARATTAAAADLARAKGLAVSGTFGALAERGTSFSESLYAHMPCYIGFIFALVTASGRIHPCCACERVVGALGEGGFAAAWRGEAYRRFREECLDLSNRLPGLPGCSCMSCPYGPWNVAFHTRLLG